jgi:hypothetical protein
MNALQTKFHPDSEYDDEVVLKGTSKIGKHITLKWLVERDDVSGLNDIENDPDLEFMLDGHITHRYGKQYDFGFAYSITINGFIDGEDEMAFQVKASALNVDRVILQEGPYHLLQLFDWYDAWSNLHAEIFGASPFYPLNKLPDYDESSDDEEFVLGKINKAFGTNITDFLDFPDLVLIDHICKNQKHEKSCHINASVMFDALSLVIKKIRGVPHALMAFNVYPLQHNTNIKIYDELNLSAKPAHDCDADALKLTALYRSLGFNWMGDEINAPLTYYGSEAFMVKYLKDNI